MKKEEQTNHEQIGNHIKTIRVKAGLTQADMAKCMNTTQSVVARIESGKQNLTISELLKIHEVLDSQVISLTKNTDDIEVEGGKELHGTVHCNFSKNGALGLMAASLLNYGTTTLHGVPNIEETQRFIEVLKSIGVTIERTDIHTLVMKRPKKLLVSNLDLKIAGKIRVSYYLIPILALEEKSFRLPNPGGCKMGNRTVSAHIFGLSDLGIEIKEQGEWYEVTSKNVKGGDVTLYEASDGATINMLLAAARIPSETIIRFCTPNYMVQEVCFFLQELGVIIDGVGTTTLRVRGLSEHYSNHNLEHSNSEDPTEAMFFIAVALLTKSEITIERCPIDFIRMELMKLKLMNVQMKVSKVYKSYNGRTDLVDVVIKKSKKLYALPDKIHALPYPGINADNLPFFVPISAIAEGRTLINDWMWENRAVYFAELNRLGAHVSLLDPHRVTIEGPAVLKGAQIVCPPALRPATIILVAMLGAEGKSTLRNVYSIMRGYEDLVGRLSKLGATIRAFRGI